MKEIRYILILVIGGVLFWVGTGLLATQLPPPPPSKWHDVIPRIEGSGPMNLTTSTFHITGKKWDVWSYDEPPPDLAQWVVEVYDASTDEKLQEFTLSSDAKIYDVKELNIRGSFYLKIQVSGNIGNWHITVMEYKPPPRFPTWIALIAVIGVASLVAFFGYKRLRDAGWL